VGAQRGIGFACARTFAAAGASVALADVAGSNITEACASLRAATCTAHTVDVADPESVRALVKEVVGHHGRIDILVNAAGVLAVRPFLEVPLSDWEHTFAVNTRGSFLLAQAVAGELVKQGSGGRIILFASIIARNGVRLNNVAYCASKAAVVQAARCMALELAPHGITVNTISPGSTATEMLVDVQARGDPKILDGVVHGNLAEWRLGIPIGRLAEPDDLAATALFLASDAARHVTGQELIVDGGQTIL